MNKNKEILNLEKLTNILQEYTMSKITYEYTTKWLLEMLYVSYLYGTLKTKDVSKILSYFNGTFYKTKNMEYKELYLIKRYDEFANYGTNETTIFTIDESKASRIPDFIIAEIENVFSKTMKKVAKKEEINKKYWKNQTFLYRAKYAIIVVTSIVSLASLAYFVYKKAKNLNNKMDI